MVPFNVIRRQVMGRDNLRAATPDEIEQMRSLVRQGMNEGAWGISTGLEYGGLNIYASTEEVIAVTEPVAEYNGVYISHMRDEAGSILDAADEIVRIRELIGPRKVAKSGVVPGKLVWIVLEPEASAVNSEDDS